MKYIKLKEPSIAKKIFFITLLSMLVIFAAFLITQGLLYGKIYTQTKGNALKNAVESFSQEYNTLNDSDEINKTISKYLADDNVYIMIVDEHGIKYAVSYEMTIETDSGEKYRFLLDNAIKSKEFKELNLKEGDCVTVSFSKFNRSKSDFSIPESISSDSGNWENNYVKEQRFVVPRPEEFENDGSEKHRFMPIHTEVSGKITSIVVPIVEYNDTVQRSDALGALLSWLDNKSDAEENISYYEYENTDTQDKYNVAVITVGDGQYIFGVMSLRHITEATSVLYNMIIPWSFIAMITALIIGMVFAGIISKPIVSLTKITTKMKNLDFSEHCKVKGNDEVGILAKNINEMSDKLDTTIKELIEANEHLKKDIEKERMLENQRKEFVAAVSHELKTPLAIIRAYTEGLIDGVSESKKEKYMNVIVGETKRMDRLVLDMLENSKLEAGAEKLNMKEYSLTKIANKYIRIFDEAFRQKNITVKTDIKKDFTAVFDCDKIEQVFSNFLSNALKNTPVNGEITINIKQNGDKIYVSVENTGENILPEELDKIWDKFYKCDKARGRKDSGTGLGLSIAKNILILHNANFGAENTENGVRFYFEI